MANIALEVTGLYKRFGTLEVLRGISMIAHQGDVISMIGASGSGKSTFLRCINLLEIPDAGEISVGGEMIRLHRDGKGRGVVSDMRQVERLRARLGMVFQSFNLWSHKTVLENVIEGPVYVQKKPKAEAIEEAEALLTKVGLSDKRKHYPAHLSGGQQQRVAIARALAMHPAVMLFDEPTSSLDPELVEEVLGVIKNLASEGRTMILVTHEMQFARDVSTHVIFLHGGQVEEQGPPVEVFRHPTSERCSQFLAKFL